MIIFGGKDGSQDVKQRNLTFRNDLTVPDINFYGDHTFKVGLKYSRQRYEFNKLFFVQPKYIFRGPDFEFPQEALLGLANGAVTGILCGIAMYILAVSQSSPHAIMLGVVVTLAMVGSCAISGVSGALVPLALKKMKFDPATASSIFVTTATDVASMGLLLGLAALMIR